MLAKLVSTELHVNSAAVSFTVDLRIAKFCGMTVGSNQININNRRSSKTDEHRPIYQLDT